MAKITRRMAEEEIQKTLNEYNKKIEDAKNYIDYLPLEGKKLVESYEKNVDNRKALLNKVVEDKSFFETLTDEQVYRLLKICEELITKFDLKIKKDNNIIEQKNDILSDEQKKHTSIEIMSEIKKLQEEMNAFGEISESQFNMFMTLAKNFNLAIIEEGNLYVNSYVKNGVITTNFEATQDSIGNYKVNYHHGIDIVGGDLISPFFLIGVGGIEKGSNDKIFSVIGTDLRMRVLHGDSDSVIKSGDFFTPGDIIMPFPRNNNFNIASTGPHFHLSNGKNFVNPYTLKQSSKIFKTTTDGGKTWSKTNFGY